jgi:hypothetical protein
LPLFPVANNFRHDVEDVSSKVLSLYFVLVDAVILLEKGAKV